MKAQTEQVTAEIDRVLMSCGELGRICGGGLGRDRVEFQPHFPLMRLHEVAERLTDIFPDVSWVISESLIVGKLDGGGRGEIVISRLPCKLPAPK